MAQEFEQVDQTELPYSLEAEQTILGSILLMHLYYLLS